LSSRAAAWWIQVKISRSGGQRSAVAARACARMRWIRASGFGRPPFLRRPFQAGADHLQTFVQL
jgi:hypothetical protein